MDNQSMILEETKGTLELFRQLILPEKVSVIIPCYNEGATVGQVIKEAMRSPLVGEVIVVDDGSSDNSSSSAREAGAKVVRHRRNLGKGSAIMSGAAAANYHVLVFIDADLQNFTFDVVDKLAQPILRKEAKLCKSTFEREAGRVTELVAKPLLEFIYPEAKFSQPLSGQFAITKELLLSLDVSRDWGVDISIILSALKVGERIVEVNIGELKHKHRELAHLAGTAREVTKTILQNAGFLAKKHKLLIFDFDGTLVQGSSIIQIFRNLGKEKRLSEIRGRFFAGEMSERKLTEMIARELKNVKVADFEAAAAKVKPAQYAHGTLEYLKRMGYRLAVVSFAFQRAVAAVFPPHLFASVICPRLHAKNGILTGKVSIPRFKSIENVFSKGRAVRHMMRKLKVGYPETIAVGNARSDEEMFREVAISVSINAPKSMLASMRMRTLPELIVIAN